MKIKIGEQEKTCALNIRTAKIIEDEFNMGYMKVLTGVIAQQGLHMDKLVYAMMKTNDNTLIYDEFVNSNEFWQWYAIPANQTKVVSFIMQELKFKKEDSSKNTGGK